MNPLPTGANALPTPLPTGWQRVLCSSLPYTPRPLEDRSRRACGPRADPSDPCRGTPREDAIQCAVFDHIRPRLACCLAHAERHDHTNRGALFKNDRKRTGTINVDGCEFWVSARLNTSMKGEKFLPLSVKPRDEAR
jgi:hypothetical protein